MVTTTEMPLASLAGALARRFGVTDAELAKAHGALTAADARLRVAAAEVERVRGIWAIPDAEVTGLAAGLADPATRTDAQRRLTAHPFTDPATSWAACGVSVVLDDVFADRDGCRGRTTAVPVPAAWPTALWHSDRDWTDDGPVTTHWVAVELPATDLPGRRSGRPLQAVLVSDGLYGTLHWGGRRIVLSGGAVRLLPDEDSALLAHLADEA